MTWQEYLAALHNEELRAKRRNAVPLHRFADRYGSAPLFRFPRTAFLRLGEGRLLDRDWLAANGYGSL